MVVDVPNLIRVADLTEAEQESLDALVNQWRKKRPRNDLRSSLYDMKNSERHLMAQSVPDVVRRRRFVLGWSGIAVDNRGFLRRQRERPRVPRSGRGHP